MILSIDTERKPNNTLSYLLVKTLYPHKVPQATEIFIPPDRVSKTSMKDRLVIKGVIRILCKEKLVLNSYEFGFFFFPVENCDVCDSKYYFIGGWGMHTLMWPIF